MQEMQPSYSMQAAARLLSHPSSSVLHSLLPLRSLVHRVAVQHARSGRVVQADHAECRVITAVCRLGGRCCCRRRCASIARFGGWAAGRQGWCALPPGLIIKPRGRHAAARSAERQLPRPLPLAQRRRRQRSSRRRWQAAHSCQATAQRHAGGRGVLQIQQGRSRGAAEGVQVLSAAAAGCRLHGGRHVRRRAGGTIERGGRRLPGGAMRGVGQR